MTVAQLIEKLKTMPADSRVVLWESKTDLAWDIEDVFDSEDDAGAHGVLLVLGEECKP